MGDLARKLQDVQDRLFLDRDKGGYFSSKEGDPEIVLRLKDDQDGAEPSSNSVAALNLLRLGRLLGTEGAKYQFEAERILKLFSLTLESVPLALPAMLEAWMMGRESPVDKLLILTGETSELPLSLQPALRTEYLPNVVWLHLGKEDTDLQELHPQAAGLHLGDSGAYLSLAGSLSPSITSLSQLKGLL